MGAKRNSWPRALCKFNLRSHPSFLPPFLLSFLPSCVPSFPLSLTLFSCLCFTLLHMYKRHRTQIIVFLPVLKQNKIIISFPLSVILKKTRSFSFYKKKRVLSISKNIRGKAVLSSVSFCTKLVLYLVTFLKRSAVWRISSASQSVLWRKLVISLE